MGQSISIVFKAAVKPSTDTVQLREASTGALMDTGTGHCANGLTSKPCASYDNVTARQKDSTGDSIAAIESASAFFDGVSLGRPLSYRYLVEEHKQNSRRTSSPAQDQVPVGGDTSNETRTPSRPVPVKGSLRRQEPSNEHFGLWRDHDDTDGQYLKRLYELRTWDMWVRITEARKRQRMCGNSEVSGEGPPMLVMEPRMGHSPPTPTTASPSDDMIFSCDL